MALFEFSMIALFVIVVLVIAISAFFFWGLRHALTLAINSVIGFFALYAVKAWWLTALSINFWSVLLVALFGFFGFILVVVLHLVGVLF